MKNVQPISKFDDLRFDNGSKQESPMFELEDTPRCLVQFFRKIKSVGNILIFLNSKQPKIFLFLTKR